MTETERYHHADLSIDQQLALRTAAIRLSGDGFSLEDFRDQLRQVKKMGSLQSLIGMLPRVGPVANLQNVADKVDEMTNGGRNL